MMQCWQNTAGFTLIEMMITVAIIAIVTAIAYPSMQKQIAQQRLKEAVNITETMLKQARADALISRSEVQSVIVPTTATSAASITLTQSIGTTPNTQNKTYNPNILITASGMPTTIRFNSEKRVYQGTTGTTALATADSTSGYYFCYKGVSSDKYQLTVDAMTNVRVVKTGVCS